MTSRDAARSTTVLAVVKQGVIAMAADGQVTLGDGLESDTVEADYSDGVLTLRIPVSAKAQPRKIEIKGAPKAELADAVETTSTDA